MTEDSLILMLIWFYNVLPCTFAKFYEPFCDSKNLAVLWFWAVQKIIYFIAFLK